MTTASTYYGHAQQEWDDLEAAMTGILETDVAHNNRLIEYQKLCDEAARLGAVRLDHNRPADRQALYLMMGQISTASIAAYGEMLTSLVVAKRTQQPSGPYFTLAIQRGLLAAGASELQKLTFWAGQTALIHARF